MKKLFKDNKQLSDLAPNILIISGVIGILFIISLFVYYWWTSKDVDYKTPYLNTEVVEAQEESNNSTDILESTNNQQQNNSSQSVPEPEDDPTPLPDEDPEPPWEQGPSDPPSGGGSSNLPVKNPPWEQGPST